MTTTPAAIRHDRARAAREEHVPGGGARARARLPLRDGAAPGRAAWLSAGERDRISAAAIESFAGVGYFLDLAAIEPGEAVLDLGSGSGTDSFLAALAAGSNGRVIGVDMTEEQLAKCRRLAVDGDFGNVDFRAGYIERPPVEPAGFDCVISNGVVNLSPDKPGVFAAAAQALRPDGRLEARRHRQRHAAAGGRHL